MRTIKFRVWDGNQFDYDCGLETFTEDKCFTINDIFKPHKDPDCFCIEQFTGLKDKNDQEIYEGDILEIPDEEVKDSVRRPYGHVWYSELSAEYIISYNHLYSKVSEQLWHREIDSFIVGNIHQNPELIH